MQPQKDVAAAPVSGGRGNVSMWLSVVAVVLAVAALVVAFAIPGPAGPQGATGANGSNGANGARGPQGLAGNGTVMGHFLALGSTTISGCTNASASATLSVPSKGNVTIAGSIEVEITHATGTADSVLIYASTSRFGGCSDSAGIANVPSSLPTDTYDITVPVALASPVVAAGTYSYTVAASSGGTARIIFAAGYVVFYPS